VVHFVPHRVAGIPSGVPAMPPVVERVPQMALSMLLCSAGLISQVTMPQRFIPG
jgi:hypothetical protein